jgi:hypothetical protein
MTSPTTTPYPPCTWTQNLPASGERAKAFLANQWELSAADRTWLTVLSCNPNSRGWQVELGIYGCPDKWVLQVNEAGVCEPAYRFKAALYKGKGLKYLESLPDELAAMLLAEHANLAAPYARI